MVWLCVVFYCIYSLGIHRPSWIYVWVSFNQSWKARLLKFCYCPLFPFSFEGRFQLFTLSYYLLLNHKSQIIYSWYCIFISNISIGTFLIFVSLLKCPISSNMLPIFFIIYFIIFSHKYFTELDIYSLCFGYIVHTHIYLYRASSFFYHWDICCTASSTVFWASGDPLQLYFLFPNSLKCIWKMS